MQRPLAHSPTRLLRKDYRKNDIGGENAPIVMPALRNDDRVVVRAHGFVDVLDEGFTARTARRALSHRVRRRVEAAEWQHVDLSEEIRRRTLDELLLQLIDAH